MSVKETYTRPEIGICSLDVTDVIATSGCNPDTCMGHTCPEYTCYTDFDNR